MINKFWYEGQSPFEISQIEFTSQAQKVEQLVGRFCFCLKSLILNMVMGGSFKNMIIKLFENFSAPVKVSSTYFKV